MKEKTFATLISTEDIGQFLLSHDVACIKKHRDMEASLLYYGYGVAMIKGSDVENPKIDNSQGECENSLLVVNIKDDPKFHKNLLELSEYYNISVLLFKPKGDESTGFGNFPYPLSLETYKSMSINAKHCVSLIHKQYLTNKEKK